MDETILAFLLDSHDEYALGKVRGILVQFPEAQGLLGASFWRRERLREDITYFSDAPPRFEFKDRVLLGCLLASASRTLARAEEEQSGLMWLGLQRDCDAVALFDLPDAHAFLRCLAKRDLGQSSHAIAVAVRFARRTLGLRGDRDMAKVCVQEELQTLRERDWFPSSEIERLGEWPREVVRECLVEAVRDDPTNKNRWVHLLSFFSSAHDVSLLKENLGDLPAELADEILQKLPGS